MALTTRIMRVGIVNVRVMLRGAMYVIVVLFSRAFVMRLITDDNGKATDTEGDERDCTAAI